jgi:hypothetical protein
MLTMFMFDKQVLALFWLVVYSSAWTSPKTTTISRVVLSSLQESLESATTDAEKHNGNMARSSLYLFSLQWTPDECISKPVRDLWKWKDATLGDGRDFFVPKPKTITALQNFCQTNANLEECSILSNCARLEILCRATHNPIEGLSSCFATQMKHTSAENNYNMSWQSVLTQKMDWPELVLNNGLATQSEQSRELERYWEQTEGMEAMLYHLSLVAAGIASRPRRPERETLFQPFSSRDAHILLQLKRTKEVAMGGTVNKILEYALRAGKAARNTDIVPELEQLRSYSKFSSEAPKALSQDIAQVSKSDEVNM